MSIRESAEQAQMATPHIQLINELLDSRIPKSEREHAAAREIERLRSALAKPEREPLTDKQIKAIYDALPGKYTLAMFARAVERAHGIGGEE